MKKKLLSLCVTVLLLAALLPLTVQTASSATKWMSPRM